MNSCSLLLLLLLLLVVIGAEKQHSKKCTRALACNGDWTGFEFSAFLPDAVDHPIPRDFYSYMNVDTLLKHSIGWIVMIGDSNTRYLFFKLVEHMCAVNVECFQYIPFYHVSVKEKGYTTFPKERPMMDLVDDSFRMTHQDHDIYVQSEKNKSAPLLRLSFRMTVGKFEKTLRSMDDMEHLYCLYRVPVTDWNYEARFLDRCETGFKVELPSEQRQRSYTQNSSHPDVLFMSFGYWDLRGLLNDTMNDLFFKKLGDLQRTTGTRVVWLTNYRFRADIIKGFNKEHWNSFRNVGDLTTLIQETNKANTKRALAYDLDIMDVDKMSERLETYYNTTFTNTHEYKSMSRDMQITKKRQFLTWDGVHQTSSFYSAMLYELSLVLLECLKSEVKDKNKKVLL